MRFHKFISNLKLFILLVCLLCSSTIKANTWVQGIYINEGTMNNASYLKYLIQNSKEVGINTFVIDLKYNSRRYQENINLVHAAGIKYVARIVVFPNGGTNAQILSQDYWGKIYKLVEQAIKQGASEIQLDYIRYDTSQPPSPKNAQNIYAVIRWFKSKLQAQNIPLQIDVFGISTLGDSLHIGQSLTLFADSIDVLCPMVYPSHYEPYLKYAKMPYFAVKSFLTALRAQFFGELPFKVYPFIELFNYRYPLSQQERFNYIRAQISAVEDSNVDGWYAWSANNKYDNLFIVLKNRK